MGGIAMSSCRTLSALLLMLALGGPARPLLADTPSTPTTAQQTYDAAQAAFDKGEWAAAITGLAAIARPDKDGKLSHAQAIIHARLARAYAHQGEVDPALREVRYALLGMAPDDYLERALLWLAIGDVQRFDLTIPEAMASYQQGLEAAQQAGSADLATTNQLGLALCYMTVDPEKAKTLLDTVLNSPAAAAYPKALIAQFNDLRGRAGLNLGQTREAMPFLSKAIKLSGGLNGTKVNLVQIGIRGDAALGALLTNHPDDAREYLAWTGAGHLPSEDWTSGIGDPPVCSEAADIRPDDMVVIEFSIAEDGQVIRAVPIYASRPGTLGIAFAQTVRKWSWNPERLAKLSEFWRNMLRIEMRCIARPNPQQLADPFRRQTFEWLTRNSLSQEDLAPLRKGYIVRDDPRLEREDLSAIPALLARLPIEPDAKRATSIAQHLTAALEKAKAPVAARALAMSMGSAGTSLKSWYATRLRLGASQVASLEQTDPHTAATAWMTLEYAIALEANGRFQEARPILERVLAYPPDTLGEHDPLRAVSTLHLAALERRAGETASADAKVQAAGLTRAQCLLFDVRPVPTKLSTSGGDFPDEALRWGFDGYVREAFDINADGHVGNVRTLVAYPPFVFRSAAEHAAARFQYLAPVVEGGAAGCDGHAININYRNAH
jgi:tetratricopeptide (TPR) repeat protein